jgi:glucose-1-phosphate cytidylyltransferase
MKAVILAGGLGTRISEETQAKPKPMVEIGERPILWHIMKIFSCYGVREFIICSGYKGEIITDYFKSYKHRYSSLTIDMSDDTIVVHKSAHEDWKITIVNTGIDTMTGGRLLGVKDFLSENEPFYFTYGDGVADIDLYKLRQQHLATGCTATVTCVIPPGRYGVVKTSGDRVVEFLEKPESEDARINGGFFILNKKAIDYIPDRITSWEEEPLKKLAEEGQLGLYRHNGFWQSMDTLRDRNKLRSLWENGKAPWKVW